MLKKVFLAFLVVVIVATTAGCDLEKEPQSTVAETEDSVIEDIGEGVEVEWFMQPLSSEPPPRFYVVAVAASSATLATGPVVAMILFGGAAVAVILRENPQVFAAAVEGVEGVRDWARSKAQSFAHDSAGEETFPVECDGEEAAAYLAASFLARLADALAKEWENGHSSNRYDWSLSPLFGDEGESIFDSQVVYNDLSLDCEQALKETLKKRLPKDFDNLLAYAKRLLPLGLETPAREALELCRREVTGWFK